MSAKHKLCTAREGIGRSLAAVYLSFGPEGCPSPGSGLWRARGGAGMAHLGSVAMHACNRIDRAPERRHWGVLGRCEPQVIPCRPTSRRDYVKQITAYNQRQWTDRYKGTKGLTFEEAASTEFPVQSILDQVRGWLVAGVEAETWWHWVASA